MEGWDKHQLFTRNSYLELVYKEARETMRGQRTDPIGGVTHLPFWWVNGEIRVFWEPSIPWQTVDLIVRAVDQRAREVPGISFDFKKYGSHESAMDQIQGALVQGKLDPQRLFSLVLSEHWRSPRRGGRQHADIFITAREFVDDPVSWAAASFKYGVMMFCLHGQRYQNPRFLHKVGLHETNHLLGMGCHCDDFQNVAGLKYSQACNMHYSCEHTNLCPKCQDHIKWWWLGVQDEMQELRAKAS